ncbi:MAG: hypothetical protein KJ558_11735 [Gammaproteobacteria bacterium]|nr:hypothetical protein [Gammaproteobacteria bacterium]MBU1655474.1 hypothetical protein [Gammaproteobacteria bacterium]MBU1959670.1 hypothetical protein [Gammaproteobacteria bacterium]
MDRKFSRRGFSALVNEACRGDTELRHEIERERYFDSFQFISDVAYGLFCDNHLTLREAFGLTEKG